MTISDQQDSRVFMPFCVLCVYKAATTYWHLIPSLLSLVSHCTAGHGMSNKHVIVSIVLNENLIKSQLLQKCLFCVTPGFDITISDIHFINVSTFQQAETIW